MRYLGIDYGSKRTGVAVSDSEGKLAVVKETIEAEGFNTIVQRLKEIVQEDAIDAIVVGMPVNMNGEPTDMTEMVERFIANLRDHVDVPVQTTDERLTTEMANTLLRGVKTEERDQVAAQILLQNFLDELSQRKN